MSESNKSPNNRYILKWKKKNVKRINLDFNITKEKDLLDQILSQENMSAYIKSLIKKDIENAKK